MTNQEYEQKRRECWEELSRANPSHNKSIKAVSSGAAFFVGIKLVICQFCVIFVVDTTGLQIWREARLTQRQLTPWR